MLRILVFFVCFSKQLIWLSLATSSRLPSVSCVFHIHLVFKAFVVWLRSVLYGCHQWPIWEMSGGLSVTSVLFVFGMLSRIRSSFVQLIGESGNALKFWCLLYWPPPSLPSPWNPSFHSSFQKAWCSYCALQ